MELYTNDLLLKTVIDEDTSEVARMWDFEKGCISKEKAQEAINYMQNNHKKNYEGHLYHLCFAIFEKDSCKIIGWCGLDGKKSPDNPAIFFLVDKNYRNKGYATQCADKLLEYAFETAKLKSVHGGCDKENFSSCRVMEKIGMAKNGTEDNGDPRFYIDNEVYYRGKVADNLKQKLIIITGSPCVGKTAVAEILFESFNNSAHFDGDWAWRVNPFSISDPRLRNGDKTMSFALSTYLNSNFDYVIFSSVVVIGEAIREAILSDITAKNYTVIAFTLKCTEETLIERHKMRGDDNEVSFQWLRMKPHSGDYVIDTDDKTVKQIVDEMKSLIDSYSTKEVQNGT